MGNQYTNHNLSHIGKKYKMLIVLRLVGYSENGKILAECKCDCGNICTKKLNNIVYGKTTYSCGCYRKKVNDERYDRQKTNFNQLYASYRLSARDRNLTFTLDEEQFKELIFSNCYYCNKNPEENTNKKINRNRADYYLKYNGIDRKDNDKGYDIDNCLSCCKICNFMKKNYTYKDFTKIIKNIYQNLNLEKEL